MKEERVLIRFDTMIAVCALLASSIAAGAMVYQTRVIEEQFSATVWPYLSLETDNTAHSFAIRLANNGAGPALIRSAQLSVDGHAAQGWNDYLRPVLTDPSVKKKGTASSQSASVDGSTTIRSGDTRPLLTLTTTNEQILTAAHKHHIALTFCYCSINNRCWNIHDTMEGGRPEVPRPVNGCTDNFAIAAEPLRLPSH